MKLTGPSFALRIAFGYALIAGLWIVVSDRILEAISSSTDWLSAAQTYKGWGFVSLTALLLYVLIRHEMTTLQQSQAARNRTVQRLENLHSLDRNIIEARSIQHVAGTAIRHLYHTIHCDAITVGMIDPQAGGDWLALSATGADDVPYAMQRLAAPPCWIKDIESGQVKIIHDAQGEAVPDDPTCTLMVAKGMRAFLYVPILVNERLSGAIALATLTPSFFTAEHRDIVAEVATELAIALEQVRLNEALSRHAAELEQTIFERQQTEQALRASQMQLTQAHELARLGSWARDLVAGTLTWSAEAFRLIGLDPSNGTPTIDDYLAEIHPKDRETVSEANRHAIESSQPVTFNFRTNPDHGPVRHFIGNTAPEFDANGHPVRLIGTLQDITELVQAKEIAHETEDRYLHALETMLESCQIIGFDWRYLYVNDAAARYGRQPKQDLLGHTMMECYPGIEETHLFDVMRMCMEKRISHMEEFEFFYADDSSAWFRTSVHPVSEGIFVLSLEITADKQAAEAINRLNAELEQRVVERTARLEAKTRELETFTYSVSHDLKAPLRGIDGYSRLLLEDYTARLDDEGRIFLTNIRHATEQMNQLIEDLLAYSRLERRELHTRQIELRPLVDMLVMECVHEAQSMNAAITTNVPDVEVFADPNGLTIALRNLLDNALKFSHSVDNPQIDIGARTTTDRCIVWVRDNGVGFDMQYHDRIFDIFQRLQRAEDYAGTGVGLAIVRKAVERIGGRIWAESAPGQGATFYVEIPRQR
ncbi:ATP-binding protein [Aggregatilinea lenta]|uniref:ATP-binding protein n=1 Tax=Aggregatilinea lenta TaxID=913108 RepID=UPI0013C3099D|nr:ATP-binding protein [Aggregatilinea lenta]